MDKQQRDARANEKNPNSAAHQAAMNNHGNQLNPTHAEHKKNQAKK